MAQRANFFVTVYMNTLYARFSVGFIPFGWRTEVNQTIAARTGAGAVVAVSGDVVTILASY